MFLGFSWKKPKKQIALPWESIDSRDGAGVNAAEASTGDDWFLEPPPGEWEMNPRPSDGSEEIEADALAAPIDQLPEEVEEEEPYPPRTGAETGAWTISVLCMGLGLIAACLVIPQADANRKLVYEREQLRLELTQVQKQNSVNREFLAKMESDPQLTERLAQREMHAVEQGETVVDVNSSAPVMGSASPFSLVDVPAPPPLEPYQPVGGVLADLCRNPQTHVYVLGIGMFLVACGLVLGGPSKITAPLDADLTSPDQ